MTALKTMAIKARVYNQIRKDLYKKKIDQISSQEKDILFTRWFNLNKEAHSELINYKRKRQKKSHIETLRKERGYKSKKKTNLEDYQKMLKETA